jgi:hypothetical protein
MPPSIVDIFYEKSYTGFDFPELIENNGELIESELGITQPHLKRRLQRGIVMRFTGMGRLPTTPTRFNASQFDCHNIKLSWDGPNNIVDGSDFFPVHKYVLQRFQNTNGGQWITVYAERGLEYTDTIRDTEDYSLSGFSPCTYRLAAWNAIGRSDYVMLTTQMQVYNSGSACVGTGNASANIVAKLTKDIDFSGEHFAIPTSLSLITVALLSLALLMYKARLAVLSGRSCESNLKPDSLLVPPDSGLPEMTPFSGGFANSKVDADAQLTDLSKPPNKKSKWTTLRTIVRSGNFNMLMSSGRRIQSSTSSTALGSHDLSSLRSGSDGIGSPEATPRDSSISRTLESGAVEVRPNGASQRPLLTKTSSFNSNQIAKAQGKNYESFRVLKKSSRSVPDSSNSCPLCYTPYSIMLGVKKHRCGKCDENFCGDCSHKISHIFAFPCKINSSCICQNCG